MNLAIPTASETLHVASFGSGHLVVEGSHRGEAHPGAQLHSAARDPLAALRELARAHPDSDLVLVESCCVLPELWLERLRRVAAASDAEVVTALGNADPRLAPWGPDVPDGAADALAVDRGCWLFGTRRVFTQQRVLRSCSLWRRDALRWLLAHPRHDSLVLPDALRVAVCDHVYVGDPMRPLAGEPREIDPRDEPPASPLATLRARFVPVATGAPAAPGLDRRPVVLHVLHGWGGGAEGFVRDLARADGERCHLALIARGDSTRRRYGERLELALPAAGMLALRRWPLPRAIAATSDGDDAYRSVLAEVLRDFAVDAVSISSLIGHSLDALRTGLPTHVVCHDYYPLWPLLHCDFGDRTRRFDAEELARELARSAATSPFAQRDPGAWVELREAYVAALIAARATLATPSASARANLLHIEPRLAPLGVDVVPHGFRPFVDGAVARSATITPPLPRGERARGEGGLASPARSRPRVLVLGRIAGGKGEQLLAPLVELLAGEIDFHLLGCGKAGEAFFGRSGVTLELDYVRDELPAAIARIAPDFALLPVTVSETWSYTLSELWALGVPPLASALGSLAERIEDGRNGWLAPAEPDAFAARVRALAADDPARAQVRDTLARLALRPLEAMVAAHAAHWPPAHTRVARHALAPIAANEIALADADHERLRLRERTAADARALTSAQRELEARADWALRMDKLSRERTQWALSLERDLGATRGVLGERQAELERATHEIERLSYYEAELARTLASRSWRITRPMRTALALLRRIRVSLAFRTRRVRSLLGRARRSVQVRGLRGTLARALRGTHARRVAPTPLQIPDPAEPFAPFALPTSDTPRVSIIVPAYGKFAHTLTCLRSLAQHHDGVPFELIVVDDASPDETPDRLAEIGGIRAIRNETNLGFIGSCNAGAALARGEYVVLLNNDTAVTPGWLAALLGTFDAFPDCGLAGAKLVYPDGRLQEAGGVVFADGSGWNYGRFDDPSDPAYEYVREVDYCSGAAIALRRSLWQQLGGFDTRYSPAYYEDTDLAFRVREAGLRVLVQPESVVVHFEGVTSGTDTASGVKRFQVVNQQKFVERWRDALARQPAPGTPIALAREHRVRGRCLIVDACTPTPDQDSGSVRMVNLMRVLVALGWKVGFFAENRIHDGDYTRALQRLGVEALFHPYLSDPVAWLREHGAALDLVILSRHYVASSFLPLVREYAPRARVVFDTVDLHYLREQRGAELERHGELRRLAAATKAQELKLVRESDVTLVVSPVEQELLRLECPGARIEVLSNVHEVVGARRGFAERRDVHFVGGFQHPPNVDAMGWFVRAIWPRVAAALPGVRFHIIGSRMVEEVERLAGPSVVVHGFVADLDPFLDGCRIAVAPLRWGAGVKGKVNMSMAHGQPVVATPVAVEGMHVRDGEDVLVAETADAFADAIVLAYNDETLWQRLSENGCDNVRRHFSFDAARAALERVLPKSRGLRAEV